MAQSVERVLGKDEVGGSNPPSSSIKRTLYLAFFFFYVIKQELRDCIALNRATEVGIRTLRCACYSVAYAPYKSA